MGVLRPYIAFSYHYEEDYNFVAYLAEELKEHGVNAWYLGKIESSKNVTNHQRLGGDFNWQDELKNWHATYVEHLLDANGVLVILSDEARASYFDVGRGMWRERAAVDYIRKDNPERVRNFECPIMPSEEDMPPGLVNDLVLWGRAALELPRVKRPMITDLDLHNLETGLSGGFQLPERKSKVTEWYELVRRDLYDVQWHCRRCSLSSGTYIMAQANPPSSCPRCGYFGGVPNKE